MALSETETLPGDYRAQLPHGLAQQRLDPGRSPAAYKGMVANPPRRLMMKDEIVDQVRQVREQQAAKFNYDLKAIVADVRKRQKNSGHQVVSFAPKPKKSV